jgi:hypothetical protein
LECESGEHDDVILALTAPERGYWHAPRNTYLQARLEKAVTANNLEDTARLLRVLASKALSAGGQCACADQAELFEILKGALGRI